MISLTISIICFLIFCAALFCVFFDQAVFTRRGTIFRIKTSQKQVSFTFDDGPSPLWTPKILEALRQANIKATFFMMGHHVKEYPDIARQVAREGHIIGNHGYAHAVLLYYQPAEIEEDIKYTEYVIKEVTGVTTRFFRPPKAWLWHSSKALIKAMGYDVILWSLNSKDWVSFHHKLIVNLIMRRVRNGDIILFHDSGNIFSREGGDRSQTVAAIPLLAKKLRENGFEIVPLEEMLYSGS